MHNQMAASPARRSLGFEWGVVALGIGIALYFILPFEPPILVLGVICTVLGVAAFLSRTYWRVGLVTLTVLLFALGALRAAVHTQAEASPKLPAYDQYFNVTGWIEAVERSGKGYRWVIRVDSLDRRSGVLPADQTPYRVRVRTKTKGFLPGDAITLPALLSAPKAPAIARGYDPARQAYFKRTGAYGFALGSPNAADLDTSGWEQWSRNRARARYRITQRIIDAAPPETAGLQAALITGQRTYIKPEQIDSLRKSGLAHILAISGLHMGLVAGGAFGFVTLLLAAINPIARRYDVRKFAAIIGIAVATTYLLLSAGSVSTQRAYIMAVVIFAAVLLGRPAISLRSVAVAAAITLWLHPEALVSPGFQMSFGATAALVAVFGAWRERFPARYTPGILRRFGGNIAGLSVTSFVAGFATGGFAAMHFHRIARYGFFANLFAMPIFSALVMPFAVVSMVALPLGLEEYPLAVMGWALSLMLTVSDKFANLPGAMSFVPAAPPLAAALYSLGFVIVILTYARQRLGGAALMGVAVIIWSLAPLPNMRVSESANLTYWDVSDTGRVIYTSRARADRYGRAQFTERLGEAGADIVNFEESETRCDSMACRIDLRGRLIALVIAPEALAEECETADLVILTEREAGPRLRRACAEKLIDLRLLEEWGAQNIYLESNRIRFDPANPERRRSRPWGE